MKQGKQIMLLDYNSHTESLLEQLEKPAKFQFPQDILVIESPQKLT